MTEDEDEGRRPDITDPVTRRPRVMEAMCATCIFRPGNPMKLRPGRLRDMVADVLRNDSFVVCHTTLPGMPGNPNGDGPSAACRGSVDRYRTNIVRIYDRLGAWQSVRPPEKDGSHGQSR